MSLKIPKFDGTHCVRLVACGHLSSAAPDLVKWMRTQKPALAAFGSGNDEYVLRYSAGENPDGDHVHIEVSKEPRKSISERPSKLETVLKKLDHYVGQHIVVDLRGYFQINLNELPEGGLVRSLLFNMKTGDVSIKVSGSTLDITGAPINKIRWTELEDDVIGVVAEAENAKVKISEEYLTSALAMLESSLRVFILGKTEKK